MSAEEHRAEAARSMDNAKRAAPAEWTIAHSLSAIAHLLYADSLPVVVFQEVRKSGGSQNDL